jgi:ubiquinone/menaquinone biosynthesis C-methylase UbiE
VAAEATAVSEHYGRDQLGELVRNGLAAIGKPDGHLTTDDLAAIDQFHTGGKAATLKLAELAAFEAGWRVLDVGGGLGGPARVLAESHGCQVTVLDLTPEFCEVGAWLTERAWLIDQVTFKVGDALAMPFADGAFDAAWTQHSSMNISDKDTLYREIHRVVRPGGRLAFHEIMAGPEQPIRFPVPWAPEPTISFLRSPAEIRGLLKALGFRERAWKDTSDEAIGWFRQRVAAAKAAQSPPHLGLHLLLGASAPQMFGNVLRNLEEGRVRTIQAVFERT